MVDIIKYNPELSDTVEALHHSQKAPYFDVPALGFVAFDSATPIAAGFLRMVEGGFAQIDSLVSNASLSSSMRNEGVALVVDHLIEAAKGLKLKGIYAHTTDEGIVRRAAELGFIHSPGIIIALPLMKRQ